MRIRNETGADIPAIGQLITAAFAPMAYSSQTEAAIVDALRKSGKLTVSLVCEDEEEMVGYIAFSPVMIDGKDCGWYGLGPVAVVSARQRSGVGSMLIREGLAAIQALSAKGCVLLGSPDYYGRFGFKADPGLTLSGVPPQYFQALSFDGAMPSGEVAYHPAFAAK